MSLSVLERASLERRALAAMEIQRRRREEGIRYFVPHVDQIDYILSDSRIRGFFAGNRTGKSYAQMCDGIMTILGVHPVVGIDKTGRIKTRGASEIVDSVTTSTQGGVGEAEPGVRGDIYTPGNGSPLQRLFPVDIEKLPQNKPIVRARYCTIDFPTIKKVQIPLLQALVPRMYLRGGDWSTAWDSRSHTLYFFDGSFMELMSYDQGRQRFQGASRHWIGHDESCPDEGIWEENKARVIDVNGRLSMVMTPTEGMTWEYEQIYERSFDDPNISIFTGDTRNNPHLPQEAIQEFMDSLTTVEERQMRIEGKFVALSGLIYPMFDIDKHIVDDFQVNNKPCTVLIDPHEGKATAVLWCVVDRDGKKYAVSEYRRQHTIPKIARDIVRLSTVNKYQVVEVVIDQQMNKHNNLVSDEGKTYFEQFSDAFESAGWGGVDIIPAPNSKNSFEDGIHQMKVSLTPAAVNGVPEFRIFRSCQRLIWEFRHYQYRKKQNVDQETYRERIRNVNDDLVTLARYYVMMQPEFEMAPAAVPVTDIFSINALSGQYPVGDKNYFGGYHG